MTRKKEGEGDLEPGIGNAWAASRDPRRHERAEEHNDHQSADGGGHGRDQIDDRCDASCGPYKATHDAKREFFDGFSRRAE